MILLTLYMFKIKHNRYRTLDAPIFGRLQDCLTLILSSTYI
jgi:hypothetical protein